MNRAIDSLYSIHLGIDADLGITEVSDTLTRYMPQIKIGDLFTDHFHVHRPSNVASFADINNHQGMLFLLIGTTKDFAVRGQFVDINPLQSPESALIFLGSPWVGWLSTNRTDIEPKISDFSAQDAQLDQIFLTITEQQNIKNLKEIALKLQAAKDEAEESNRIRTDFFAVMNHEMRTPLNGVITALNLLDTAPMSSEDKNIYKMAMDSADNLLVVINNVLDFSKLEAGKFEIEETNFQLNELLTSVQRILIAKATDKGIELKIDVPSELTARLIGDDSKIRQVLLNLVSNAIKFTDEGSVIASVQNIGDHAHPVYRFSVTDTGHGVNPEKEQQIFQPFWTEVQGRAEIGTGLGLYICQRLVEMMGGEILFTSTVGEGSKFWFDIALAISSDTSDIDDENEASAPIDFVNRGGRVLLVEDNSTNQALAKILIKGFGPDVDVANDGVEAIELIQSYPYDLVLMDINMPNMGGIEATQIIRKDARFDDLPIVALTAYSGASHREKYLGMGMNGYLRKPIDSHQLATQFSKWLPVHPDIQHPADEPNSSTASPKQIHQDRSKYPAIDSSIFLKLFNEVGEIAFDSILEGFLQDIENGVTQMDDFIELEQLDDLAREAHSLCSCARTYGASNLGDQLEELEAIAKQGDINLVTKRAITVVSECRQLPAALKAVRASIESPIE